jgi:hypothetical protein
MFKIKIGVLLAAVVAVFAVSAAPAMSFTEFVQKGAKSGNQGKGGKQVFKTKTGNVECEEEKSNGGSKAEKQTKGAFEEVKYEKCKAFGVATTIPPLKYLFKPNNTVGIQNKIIIKPEGSECEIEVGPIENNELGQVKYINNNPGITIEAHQKEIITYTVLKNGNGLCTGTKGVAHNGSYDGVAKTETYSGSLPQWTGLVSEGGEGEINQVSYSVLEIR